MDALKKINWKQPKYMIPLIIYFPLLFPTNTMRIMPVMQYRYLLQPLAMGSDWLVKVW